MVIAPRVGGIADSAWCANSEGGKAAESRNEQCPHREVVLVSRDREAIGGHFPAARSGSVIVRKYGPHGQRNCGY